MDYRIRVEYVEIMVVLQTLFNTDIGPHFIFTHVDKVLDNDDDEETLDDMKLRFNEFVKKAYKTL